MTENKEENMGLWSRPLYHQQLRNIEGHIWMAITTSNLLVDIYKDFQVQKTKTQGILTQQSQCYQAWLHCLTGKTQLLTPMTRKEQLILLPYFWR